jgi:hypothetical protein
VVESGALLKRCTPKGYPGFESLPHRSILLRQILKSLSCPRPQRQTMACTRLLAYGSRSAVSILTWGLRSKRPCDSCGLTASPATTECPATYIAAHPDSGFGVQSNEFVGEIFYSFDVYHGLYIINPAGYTRATNQPSATRS